VPPEDGEAMTQVLNRDQKTDGDEQACSVGLVLTGGTIGARENDSVLSVGQATEAEAKLISSAWPGTGNPNVRVISPLRQLSENFKPADWLVIAHAVRELVETERVTSVLVLHGTDTMAYTASALSFLLADIGRPIVLTGSNVPSGHPDSDAVHNVRTALIAAQALERGTYVAFAGGTDLPGQVHLGTRLRKLRASREAFASINRGLVGVVRSDEFVESLPYHAQSNDQCAQAVDGRVLALRLYPGLDFEATFQAVVHGDIRGVVIELYASATGPDTQDRFSVTSFIRRCTEHNIVVGTTVAESPDHNGTRYDTTIAIHAAGSVFLRDMLPETATVKMMWALGQSSDPDEVRQLMLRSIAGEISGS
jgi:L-asparaginase type I